MYQLSLLLYFLTRRIHVVSTWKLCSEKKVIIYVGTTEHSFIIYYRLVRLWAGIYSRKFSFINYASRDEILAKPLTQGRLVFAFGTSSLGKRVVI